MSWEYYPPLKITELLGKTLIKIDGKEADDKMVFTTNTGDRYKLYHSQDCCESVYLNEVIGDLDDLLGSPIIQAEEVSNVDEPPKREEYASGYVFEPENYTWTFYKLATIKGSVTLRWYGESNGYYSESVDFCKLTA